MEHQRPKILLVDDRPENLFALEQTLKPLNASLTRAMSGEEALSQVLRQQFALILMDVQMPGMDGFEAVSLMRDYDDTKNVPVIFVTAISKERQFVEQGYESGAVDYLFKPIAPGVLLSKVKVFLELEKQRIELEEAVKKNQQMAAHNETVLDCIIEGIISFNSQGLVDWANPTALRLLGMTLPQIAKSRLFDLFHLDPNQPPIEWDDFEQTKASGGHAQIRSSDHLLKRPDKTTFPVEFSMSGFTENIQDGGVFSFQDITERKWAENELIRLAQEDSLTQLPNRALFHEFLRVSIQERMRDDGNLALLMLDMDDFKRVNDTLGHDVGDKLLQSVSARLEECLRQGDLVARLGGDEFGIILPVIRKSDDAGRVANKILKSFEEPHQLGSYTLTVGASIGISTYPEGGTDMQELIKSADTAMYHAKGQGRNNFQFFSREMQERVLAKDTLEKELIVALKERQFISHYQPKIAANGDLTGYEALVRWQHPTRGLVFPGDFIELVEETGLVVELGKQMLEMACEQNKRWIDEGVVAPNTTVAVNVSVRQLSEKSLVNTIKEVLDTTGLAPECLEVEITEYTMMNDVEHAIIVLSQLRELGVKVAIDDFGTGYSSLTYLSKLPLNTLKVDQYFVNGIGEDPGDESIVKATIHLAHSLNLEVTAEGVETDDQRKFLIENNVNYLQGYFFSKPQGAESLQQWILEKNFANTPKTSLV
ncbi:EAL domain-containing protein [Psychrobium sp. MM17-31]|uniref:two-component system response regulator n=1 Tax=Psychrobium sp. MM17-31 TaxID=2917758 RepID=UPI001EF70AA8|nr:EAL domain-containing protein [Psychrobium sp. MM17-31]MCG7532106.1 EAL domain-containing protein [Psychrobium sp. MM17-31]